MARYGQADVTVEFDNSGGTLVDISNYVTEIGDVPKEALLEQVDAMGDSWEEWAHVGVSRGGEIELGGPYDDTATTGPDALLNAVGSSRELKFTFGGTKTVLWNTIIKSYTRVIARGELTKFKAVLQTTGSPTEA